jgi:selenocysteine lyase/cysteine desulfurase
MYRQMNTKEFWNFVTESIIGNTDFISTSFGKRKITYADYTASGRGVSFIEDYLRSNLILYGNTHTTDNATGSVTTARVRQAEEIIKRSFDAPAHYALITAGTGTTGAIHRLQQILGVYIPPAFRTLIEQILSNYPGESKKEELKSYLNRERPVVFIGPYEHHSNVVSWRECFAEVVDIELDNEGLIDLADLEKKVSQKKYAERMKIGSFSAASNVTGIKSPVFDIASILHQHTAYAFFDCAAIAPYNRISVFKDEENYLDGIFFSPHKFLGGPGSSGILILNEGIYKKDLPPTCAGGGTVDFVNLYTQEYSKEIEVREKPGTPGILQIMKAALAVELKERLDPAQIEKREDFLLKRVFLRLQQHSAIEIVGNPNPEKRIAIVSFNIKSKTAYLHPKYVAVLLNDLFGIQARAGCLCAGPYAHRLFRIDKKESDMYRAMISKGHKGIKPGWVRVGYHFLMTDEEIDFICDAIVFIAKHGTLFLSQYKFDMDNESWTHVEKKKEDEVFGLDYALKQPEKPRESKHPAAFLYDHYLKEAEERAEALEKCFSGQQVKEACGNLIPFLYYDHSAG